MKQKIVKVPQPKKYDIIEITERKCSDKLQPNIKLNDRYMCLSVGYLSDNTPYLNIQSLIGKKQMRVNAKRFGWKIITAEMLVKERKEQEAKENILNANKAIKARFTKKETEEMLYLPSALIEIALKYANNAYNLSRGDKDKGIDGLSQFKKASRELTPILTQLNNREDNAFGQSREQLQKDIKAFEEANAQNIFLFRNVINMEYKRINPHTSNRELDVRTDALLSAYFVTMYIEQEAKVDKMIADKFGRQPVSNVSNLIVQFKRALAQFIEVYRFNYNENQNIKNGYRAIRNATLNFKFHLEPKNNKL